MLVSEDCSGDRLALIFSLCRGTKELKYEVKGDDDPAVKAWDDIVLDEEDK